MRRIGPVEAVEEYLSDAGSDGFSKFSFSLQAFEKKNHKYCSTHRKNTFHIFLHVVFLLKAQCELYKDTIFRREMIDTNFKRVACILSHALADFIFDHFFVLMPKNIS